MVGDTASSPRHFDPRLSASSSAAPSAARVILHSVSGFAAPGQLLAIMGGSGSGKTTLLNVLAGRLRDGRAGGSVSGELQLNGRMADASLLSCVSAYVMQDDVLMPVMTAREHIQWSADMRLNTGSAHNKAKVDDILAELGLTKCADIPVGTNAAGDGGGQGGTTGGGGGASGGVLDNDVVQAVLQQFHGARRGLSGGEQRRVSIAMELVTDPLLLFIDGQNCRRHIVSHFLPIPACANDFQSRSAFLLRTHQRPRLVHSLYNRGSAQRTSRAWSYRHLHHPLPIQPHLRTVRPSHAPHSNGRGGISRAGQRGTASLPPARTRLSTEHECGRLHASDGAHPYPGFRLTLSAVSRAHNW